MPKGGEEPAREFYSGLLGLHEIPKPESIRHRGGVWFDAGGLDLHLSVEENRAARIVTDISAWSVRMSTRCGRD